MFKLWTVMDAKSTVANQVCPGEAGMYKGSSKQSQKMWCESLVNQRIVFSQYTFSVTCGGLLIYSHSPIAGTFSFVLKLTNTRAGVWDDIKSPLGTCPFFISVSSVSECESPLQFQSSFLLARTPRAAGDGSSAWVPATPGGGLDPAVGS